jgi:hypothetical protein
VVGIEPSRSGESIRDNGAARDRLWAKLWPQIDDARVRACAGSFELTLRAGFESVTERCRRSTRQAIGGRRQAAAGSEASAEETERPPSSYSRPREVAMSTPHVTSKPRAPEALARLDESRARRQAMPPVHVRLPLERSEPKAEPIGGEWPAAEGGRNVSPPDW